MPLCSNFPARESLFIRGGKVQLRKAANPGSRECALFLDVFNHARFFGTFALGVIKNFFAQAQIFRRGLHVFIHVNVFQGAFQRELERRRKRNALAIAL